MQSSAVNEEISAIASTPALKIENLTKRFGEVVANDHICFDVEAGEIHCLLGENGAGKSTLMECLYGYYQPDSGHIFVKGKPVAIASPRQAIRMGIGMVHQHFELVESLSVIENIFLATEASGFWLDLSKARKKVQALCELYGVDLDLDTEVAQLSVGQQQWVEILKALYNKIDLLILDEPTAVLTPQESERLFQVLQQMKNDGLAIILISHKLDEVLAVADRITVLRKGKHITTVHPSDVSKTELASLMVGRQVSFQVEKTALSPGNATLILDRISAHNDRGHPALNQLSLTVHQHEIVGIAGVAGNGQKELSEVLIGVRPTTSGNMWLDDESITALPPQSLIQRGIAMIPQDRLREGLIGDFSIAENLILGLQHQPPFSQKGLLKRQAIADTAKQHIQDFEIATPSHRTKTRSLSGGNLQKVILAREITRQPKLIIANYPSRGLDVGAIEYVHSKLLEQRDRGAGILLISEELDELFSLSDRIAILYRGQILGVFPTSDITLEKVGLLMAGVQEGDHE